MLKARSPFLRMKSAFSGDSRVIFRKGVLVLMSTTPSTTTEFFSAISSLRSSRESVRSLGGRNARIVRAERASGDSTSLSPSSASLAQLPLEECSARDSWVARVTITNFPEVIHRT